MGEDEEGVTTVFEIGCLYVGVEFGGEAVAYNTVRCGGCEIDICACGGASQA